MTYRSAQSGLGKRFLEVDREIWPDMRAMAAGKRLHTVLDVTNGTPRTSGKAGAHAAWKADSFSRSQYLASRKVLEAADAAKHITSTASLFRARPSHVTDKSPQANLRGGH